MKIGFDAKRYFHNNTGLGNYSRVLVNELCKHFPEHDYFLFDKRPNLYAHPENAQIIRPSGTGFLWRESGIIKDIAANDLEVFHGLSNELPFGKFPSSTKKIVTIHDVIFKPFPEHYKWMDRTIYDIKTKHAIEIADTIIATSIATSDDLIKYYKADKKRIEVVYQSCGKLHQLRYSNEAIETFRKEKGLNEPYLLYVSSFQFRKNHSALIKAFADLKQNKTKLVLAGRKGETYDACVALIKSLGIEKLVNLVDDISAEELPLLYRGAKAFVYPSLVEGFGIPLIEAAFAGLPMAVNNIAVFKEIAPDGTLYFDTKNEANMVDALQQLLEKGDNMLNYDTHLKRFDEGKISTHLIKIYNG